MGVNNEKKEKCGSSINLYLVNAIMKNSEQNNLRKFI